MIDIDNIIAQAVRKEATDIHLMVDSKPMYRIGDALVKMTGIEPLKNEDMKDIYKHFTKGNVAKKQNIDTIYEYNKLNVGVNLSYANNTPVFTMKILKNKLPEYEELNLPDILRKMVVRNRYYIQ